MRSDSNEVLVGGKRPGSSSEATVTSILSGEFECEYVRDVPQEPQNVRTTSGDEACATGLPDEIV